LQNVAKIIFELYATLYVLLELLLIILVPMAMYIYAE